MEGSNIPIFCISQRYVAPLAPISRSGLKAKVHSSGLKSVLSQLELTLAMSLRIDSQVARHH